MLNIFFNKGVVLNEAFGLNSLKENIALERLKNKRSCVLTRSERRKELHQTCCQRLENAYGKVRCVKLFEVLQQTNINHTIFRALRELYRQSTTKVKTGNNISKGFFVTKGLRQGLLYPSDITLSNLPQVWKSKCKSMGLKLDIDIADDQVLISQDQELCNIQ